MDEIKIGKYKVDDINALPEGQHAELIDGVWFDQASPKTIHQELVGYFTWAIKDYIIKKGGKCKVFPAPFAVMLQNDGLNYLEPDISVICDESKIKEDGCHGAPDWIIEILSSSTRKRDLTIKLSKYSESGVREYWIVDPDNKRVFKYALEKINSDEDNTSTIETFTFRDEIPGYIFPELIIKSIPD